MLAEQNWRESTWVAFDTETSGAFPVGSDIVEVGLVKWSVAEGREIDRLQFLLRPAKPIPAEVIKIHGITNEDVATAPLMKEKISQVREFLADSVLLAHHAPFDLGFLVYDFERFGERVPVTPVLCTSLLARALIPEAPNHKLQTLIPFLSLPSGQAHRALDDAIACLHLGLQCAERFGEGSVSQLAVKMKKRVEWQDYMILNGPGYLPEIVRSVQESRDLDIVYNKGSIKGKTRRITPLGIVRNPDGDYVPARCHIDGAQKRFYLREIADLQICH